MAIVRRGNDVCGAGCASAGAIIVIGRFSEVTGRGKRLRPARRWKSWMPTFGPSGAKPKPLSRGTEGSNPSPSSEESATNRSRRRRWNATSKRRDRWFEAGSLQRRVRLSTGISPPRSRSRAFRANERAMPGDGVGRDRYGRATSHHWRRMSLLGQISVPRGWRWVEANRGVLPLGAAEYWRI